MLKVKGRNFLTHTGRGRKKHVLVPENVEEYREFRVFGEREGRNLWEQGTVHI